MSGAALLPPEEEMMRAVEEYRARDIAGEPAYRAYFIPAVDRNEVWEFVYRHTDMPRMEDWKVELFVAGVVNAMEDRETYRDRDDDSESVREGVRRWRRVAGAQYEAAPAAGGGGASDNIHADADAAQGQKPPLPALAIMPSLNCEV